jgi:hypothetical protein
LVNDSQSKRYPETKAITTTKKITQEPVFRLYPISERQKQFGFGNGKRDGCRHHGQPYYFPHTAKLAAGGTVRRRAEHIFPVPNIS